MFAPTVPQYTKGFTDALNELGIPYIYIDSQIKDAPPLAFFGQNSHQSGYFAARMLMLLAVNDGNRNFPQNTRRSDRLEPAGKPRNRISPIYARASSHL